MEKEIKITFEQTLDEKGEYALQTELETKGNISPFELLGVLRHFEKQVWVKIVTASQVETIIENQKND